MSSPPLDICKLEVTEVAAGIDMNEVWRVTCLLYDETDNIRITGNPKFDSRYLNYRSRDRSSTDEDDDVQEDDSLQPQLRLHVPQSFYSVSTRQQADVADGKVKGDWKAHFFTRTVQILLHSFDPSKLPDNSLKHSNVCKSLNDSETECDCWGEGLDPDHRAVLLRLMTVPPQSNISKAYRNCSHRSNHFQEIFDDARYGRIFLPFRFAQYFGADFQTSSIELLSLVVETCHFRPKLLPVRCEYFFYTDIYRTYIQNPEKWVATMSSIFTDFLSNIECLEFFWVGGLRDKDVDLNIEGIPSPVTLMPKLFIESAFSSPTPKLDTIEISMFKFMTYYAGLVKINFFPDYMPKADSCLQLIAPFFCSLDGEGQSRIAYNGLKRIHISGIFEEEISDSILSSLLGNQRKLEGVRLSCKAGRLDKTRDTIASLSAQPHLEYLIINMWQVHNHSMDDFREVFDNFVDSSSDCALSLSSVDHNITLAPPSSHFERCRVLRLYTSYNNTYRVGRLFEWLQSRKVNLIAISMVIKGAVERNVQQYVCPYLSTCKWVKFDSKVSTSTFSANFLSRIASNENILELTLNNCKIPVADFCQALEGLYARNKELKRLSYCSNKLNKVSKQDLELFFKTVLSYSQLDQLVLDIRKNNLTSADMETMKNAWRSVAQGRIKGSIIQGRIKGVIVDKDLRDCQALNYLVA